MLRAELTALLPKHRDDVNAAVDIIKLGYPILAPVMPSLFQWLETSGSPVELIIRPFFANLGEPALILVKNALESSIKPALKLTLLSHVLPYWDISLLNQLEPQLKKLIFVCDFHGLDVLALKLLINKGVQSKENLAAWQHMKIQRLIAQLLLLQSF